MKIFGVRNDEVRISHIVGSLLIEPFWDLWMRQTAVDTASYGNFSCQITLAQEGRILQEIHFK